MRRLIGLLVVMVVLAGCGAFGQPSADEIVRRAEAAIENLEMAHAVVEVEATLQDENFFVVGEGWMDGERHRAEVLEASMPEAAGLLVVSDGTQGWLLHPAFPMLLTGQRAEIEAYLAEEALQQMPEANLDGLTSLVDELLRITDQELVGSETIAGFETWHLRLTPNAEAPVELVAVGGSADLWISKTDDMPLQVVIESPSVGALRVTVREYDPAPRMEDALFTVIPEDGVMVVDVATLLPERMLLPEAIEAAPFPLLSTPADSGEAALVGVYRLRDHFVQEFEGSLGTWQLMQGAQPEFEGLAGLLPHPDHADRALDRAGETVTVRGQPGTLLVDEEKGAVLLSWQEDGVWRVISGAISPESALRLAGLLR